MGEGGELLGDHVGSVRLPIPPVPGAGPGPRPGVLQEDKNGGGEGRGGCETEAERRVAGGQLAEDAECAGHRRDGRLRAHLQTVRAGRGHATHLPRGQGRPRLLPRILERRG